MWSLFSLSYLIYFCPHWRLFISFSLSSRYLLDISICLCSRKLIFNMPKAELFFSAPLKQRKYFSVFPNYYLLLYLTVSHTLTLIWSVSDFSFFLKSNSSYCCFYYPSVSFLSFSWLLCTLLIMLLGYTHSLLVLCHCSVAIYFSNTQIFIVSLPCINLPWLLIVYRINSKLLRPQSFEIYLSVPFKLHCSSVLPLALCRPRPRSCHRLHGISFQGSSCAHPCPLPGLSSSVSSFLTSFLLHFSRFYIVKESVKVAQSLTL